MATPTVALETIKLVIFDIDGVLTDGTLYYGAEGECVKPFNVKDGVGFGLLQGNGVAVAVITAKESAPLAQRMKDLKINHFFPGCSDKITVYERLKQQLSVVDEEAAYVGDDVLDLSVMNTVGLAIAPADAYPLVKQSARIVTEAKGGQGVAREVADLLVGARTDLEAAYYSLVGIVQ
ncbi:HAD-IIIA family hydrolase [Candidatus Sororendozoicomonas aggregata]|uniref:KdsC family phosphatase n=1 Tax=Candidatus Sororendozoicomonas aggregata TaxID=3073239 RepID=UPI002ED67422